jgi:D-alanyl-D-alanine carboxypeptidase
MKTLAQSLLVATVLITCTATTMPAQVHKADTDNLRASLQTYLDSVHAAGRFPGATLGVALPDGTLLELAAGVSDRTTGAKMQPDGRMLAGSVGKTFIAALALDLVQKKQLDLAAPISRYLGSEPWFPQLPNAQDITVRMLLNHTSGLVRYEFNPAVTQKLTNQPDHIWTPAERVSYILNTNAPFAAGAGWDYSDTNYIVLGMIIEKVTGRDIYAQVASRFLEPLQLRRTLPSDRRDPRGVVQGYAGPQNPFGGRDEMIADGKFIVNPQMEWTGGGYATTSGDLAKWAKLLYEGKAIAQPAVDLMLASPATAQQLGGNAQYGLGVIIRQTPLGSVLGHSGFFPGYLTEMRYFPAQRFAVALQFNSSAQGAIGRAPGAVAQEIARRVAEALQPAGAAR